MAPRVPTETGDAPKDDPSTPLFDESTGEAVVLDYDGNGTGTGPTSSGTNTRREGGVTIATPESNTEGTWFPKVTSSMEFGGSIPSSGALGQWAAGVMDPESAVYNETQAQSSLAAAGRRPTQYGSGQIFAIVAAGRGHNSTANGVLQGYAAESAAYNRRGIRITPYQLAYQEALEEGWIGEAGQTNLPGPRGNGPGGNGPGGGAAPPAAPLPGEIRRAMDQVTMGLIGRTLSDKEFSRYYEGFKATFNSTGGRMDPTQNMIEAARKDDNYQEFQVATKFASALDSVLRGAA